VDQLISEGYAEGRRGSGVYVAADLPDHLLQARRSEVGAAGPAESPLAPPVPVRPFQGAAPDLSLFPHREWSRLLDRLWRDPGPNLLANADPLGWAPLRTAIADHLGAWRGITCSPHQLVVTSGAAEAVELLARVAFRPGDSVLIEEPGYRILRRALTLSGLVCRPVPVDEQGFDIARGAREAPEAKGVAVTPSRHYPLGMTLPLSRRLALLDWARRTGGIIIEDDYDSEYRYQGRPLPALMSLDDSDRVIYVGSFSKVLAPSLRLGFLVVPPPMVASVSAAMADTGPRASLVAQPVLARFMAEGSFAAHIRRTRRIYAGRQRAMLTAIGAHLNGLLEADPAPAGMHLVADLAPSLARRMSDGEATARAAAAGITLQPLSSYYAGAPLRQGLILGYAGFDEAAIAGGIETLKEVLAC
jgi:GntR family transcriptional regulator/MocR family aminotransferase